MNPFQPFSAGLVRNRPAGGMTVAGRLFQAAMWRRYAMDLDLPCWNNRRRWVERILQRSRVSLLRQCRVNIYLARRLNRRGNHG